MVDGSEYNIRNGADSVKDAFKRIIAPYGTNMSFVEILSGTLISTDNIVSIRELSDEEVNAINMPKEVEEVVGLTETEVDVEEDESEEENSETDETEAAQ